MSGKNFTLKEEIREFWSDRAKTFDQSASHHISALHGMSEWRNLIHRAFDGSSDDQLQHLEALDLACGTGEVSKVLLDLGMNVTAVDFSEPMLDVAKSKHQLRPNWSGFLMDVEHLAAFEDNTFDLAITRHLVWTLLDPSQALAEWHRVLKPGGRLIVVDGNWAAGVSPIQRVRNWIAELFNGNDKSKDDWRLRNEEIKSRLFFRTGLTNTILQAMLTDAGFQDVQQLDIKLLYHAGMRDHDLKTRLTQHAENRFCLTTSKQH